MVVELRAGDSVSEVLLVPLIQTADLQPGGFGMPEAVRQQVYCGLDSCVTLEVHEELSKQFNQPPEIYNFERALQGPYLEIMQRGFAVDTLSRRSAVEGLQVRLGHLQRTLNEIVGAIWDRPLNPRSSDQIKNLFYGIMKLPEQWISQKGVRKLSMNREVLEKLEQYLYARPIIACILAIRDLAKQLEVLETEIDGDGRFRTSYNIAGTETGRPSSSKNAYGTGGNAQNIAPGLRYIFVADRGKKICVIDLEQVEARDVGFFCGVLFNDWTFLDNCESGDLHTNNSKLIWREKPWTGDARADRALADVLFYRDFSFRDMTKRGSHLSNYMGTAWTASRVLKVPLEVMDEFQARYCKGRAANPKRGLPAIEPAFPCIPRFWQWVSAEIQTTFQLTTPFGRRRHFFGRVSDDTTLREAIAFLPQSTTADRANLGLWRIWKQMPECQLLAQTYDSVTFQFDETLDERELIPRALALMRVELKAQNGRLYVVPGEAKVGWNWGARVSAEDIEKARLAGKKLPRLNTDGLVKWSSGKPDARTRTTGLQRVMM